MGLCDQDRVILKHNTALAKKMFFHSAGPCFKTQDPEKSLCLSLLLIVCSACYMYVCSLYLFSQCDNSADWRENGAGFHHSHQHGFGLLSAWRLVNAAKVRMCLPPPPNPYHEYRIPNFSLVPLRYGSLCHSLCPIRAQ